MDNVRNTITNAVNGIQEMSEYNKLVVFLLVVFLIILLYLLYEYSYSRRNFLKIKDIDYDENINLQPLTTCSRIEDPLEEYILADYYIASSFKTSHIGNQKYDYHSLDMIQKALQSGARYIELEICKGDLGQGAIPVIATGDANGDWISSLNSLDITDVLTIIEGNSFITKNKAINYPLFIYLYLNTDDKTTLNTLSQNIKTKLGKYLLSPENYYKYPISLEKICRLLNKIVIFASPRYQNTQLEEIIIPTNGFLNRITHLEVGKFNIDLAKENTIYNKTLSKLEQRKTLKYFKEKYPTFKNIKYDVDYLEELKNDDMITDILSYYNKVGMTVVMPHTETDVFSLNYNPTYAWNTGCQFVAMNYQVKDENMSKYIRLFSNSSFILKPTALRFHREREPLPDMMKIYAVEDITKPTSVIPDFRPKYANKLIAIESLNDVGYYLTIRGENLIFTKGEFKNGKISNINQCFLVKPSRDNENTVDFMLASAKEPTKYIVKENNYYYLKFIGNNKEYIKNATFSPVIPVCKEDEYVSFKIQSTIDLYLSNNKRNLKVNDSSSPVKRNSTCFRIELVPYNTKITFQHYSGKYLKSNKDGLIFLEGDSVKEAHKFELIGNYLLQPIYIKNYMGKFVSYKDNKRIEAISIEPMLTSLFEIVDDNNTNYKLIMNKNKEFVSVMDNGIILMKKDRPLLVESEMDENGAITKAPIYGEKLLNKHKFKVKTYYSL